MDLTCQNGGIEIIDPALFLQSHNDIMTGIYEDVRSRTPISRYMIRCMHVMFTEFQDYSPGVDSLGRRVRVPLRKGLFKRFPNNPVRPDGLTHEYCPPPQVDSEIDNLLRLHDEHVAKNVPVDVEAAWFHHCFVQIHPFQDGNGRMARALASLIYIKAGYPPPVVTLKGKPDYLKALDAANQGDLKPFVDYLASLVVKQTKRCLRLSRAAKV
ncbi:MAG: Fic family protein [Deltaproteobacteria bacterium]|nr:Fic family protein [Deltaproteobacteria bacterium]